MTQEYKATLYYKSEFPAFGYTADLCHLREHKLVKNWHGGLGNVVVVYFTRKNASKARLKVAAFGRGHELVIVKGWNPEFENATPPKHYGPVVSRTQRFTDAAEWSAAFDVFLLDLETRGIEVIADYRHIELGHPSPLGFPRDHKFEPPTDKQPSGAGTMYVEGAQISVELDVYERDPKARQACIDQWGAICRVCGFDFDVLYPGIGKGFIEVHHLKPLSQEGDSHTVDPINDLIPVCPNCHAMLHRRRPIPFSPDELKKIMEQGRDDEPPF